MGRKLAARNTLLTFLAWTRFVRVRSSADRRHILHARLLSHLTPCSIRAVLALIESVVRKKTANSGKRVDKSARKRSKATTREFWLLWTDIKRIKRKETVQSSLEERHEFAALFLKLCAQR